jgi:hypothetical protein
MSAAGQIFAQEIARNAQEHNNAPAHWRGSMSDLERANFVLAHNGQTPEQVREGARIRERQDYEAEARAEYEGDPPGTHPLMPAKDVLGCFVAWRDKTKGELDGLQGTLAK